MSTNINNKNEHEKDFLNDSFYKPKFNSSSPDRDEYKFYSETSKGKFLII